jgi:hypothetical protein
MVRGEVIGLMTTVLLSLTDLGVASAKPRRRRLSAIPRSTKLVSLSARIVSSTSPERSKSCST